MNNLYLKYCFQSQIPLPEVFQYLSKKNTPQWESEKPAKQLALKSYLMFFALNYQLRKEFINYEEPYEKPQLFKDLITVIYQNQLNIGSRLSDFMIHYDKLIKVIKSWNDDDTLLLMTQIKNQYEIELPKRKYFKKLNTGKKNIILQILQSCILKEDPVIEVLNALEVCDNQLELVQDERLIYALKQKTPCLLFNDKQGLNEQKIILSMVQIINQNKNKFINEISAINSQSLLQIQDLELQYHLKQIFQQNEQLIVNKKEKDLQSKQTEINIRQDVIRKQFRIYIQHVFENKLPLPEIVLVLQFPIKPTLNFGLNPSKEFLFEINKRQSFQIFNKLLYVEESIFQWSNSINDLEWLNNYLDQKFPMNQGVIKLQTAQQIIENLQDSYNQRHQLRDRIIEVFNHTRAKWFMNQFHKKIPSLNQNYIKTGDLLVKLQEFVQQETKSMQKIEKISK